jgi:cell division protein FtsQ
MHRSTDEGDMKNILRMPRRLTISGAGTLARSRGMGFAMRGLSLLAIAVTLAHGAIRGGYLNEEGSPWFKISGKLSGIAGMAADDIRITGLNHQSPETVLKALGVRPGGSLIGFDTSAAKSLLESLDWVASAKVQRLFPNQLEIEVAEREPFAVWQKAGSYYVIDRAGRALSSLDPSRLPALPLVTGEGAETAAFELVNQLEATPDLLLKLYAAARVGKRRWTLYFDHGVTVALPEKDVGKALARLQELETGQQLLSKGIKTVDLRFADRVIVGVVDGAELAAGAMATKGAQAN